MRPTARLLLFAVCSAACGARSSLDTASSRDDGLGGDGVGAGAGVGAGSSVGGGGLGPPGCETVTVSPPALTEPLLEGPFIESATLTMLGGGDDRMCAVGPITEQAFANFYGSVCFDAFDAWPSSLGIISPIADATNAGIRVAPGEPSGMAALTGESAGPTGTGAKFTPGFQPGTAPSWTLLPGKSSHRAAFLARAQSGTFYAGLVAEQLPYVSLELHHFGDPSWASHSVACATSHIAADALDHGGSVIVATSGGRPFGSCADDDVVPGPPTRLQVATLAEGGASVLLHDEDLGDAIADLRMEDAGDSVWVVAGTGETWQLRRILKTGGVAATASTSPEVNAGMAFDTAMLGDDLLLSHITISSGSFGVQVDAYSRSAERAPLGSFDAGTDIDPLAIAVGSSPDDDAVVVAYSTAFSGQLVARRFDCVAE